MGALGLSMTLPMGADRAGPNAVPASFRFVSNSIIGVPKNFYTTTTAVTRNRTKITLAYASDEIWVGLPGFYVTTSGVETTPTTVSGFQVQISIGDGTSTQFLGQGGNTLGTASGNTTFALNMGGITWVRFLASQLSLSQFAANTTYWLKAEYTGTIGDQLPIHDDQGLAGVSGEACFAGGTSQLTSAGGITAGGGTSKSVDSRPCAIVARHSNKAVLGVGDSILYGQGRGGGTGIDTGDGAYGMLGRALFGTTIAYGKYARQGIRASTLTGAQMLALTAFATHCLCQPGTNDIGSDGVSLATLQTREQTLWAALKGANSSMKIYPLAVLIRCSSSSNSWIDAAGQTTQTNYIQSGGNVQFDYNAYLAGGGITNVDGYVNINSAVEDTPTNPGKFKSDGSTTFLYTVEGTHPALTAQQALGVALAPIISGWA